MLTPRQSKILAAIVKDYSQKGEPVGSQELAERYHFGISPATIRNEMKELEKIGLITQPHTSAGRVPTDRGYRYFINKLMNHLELTAAEQSRLRRELARLQEQYLELGRGICRLLAQTTHGAAFALLPESTAVSGLAEVIDQHLPAEEIKELAKFLDELEDQCRSLTEKDIKDVTTFVGREAPVNLGPDFSLLVSRVRLPSGQHGLIGIIGPKRMKYARNISLLEYISKLLSAGLGAIILINLRM